MNDHDLDELAKTVKFMRKHGVTALRITGMEVELGPEPEFTDEFEGPVVDKSPEVKKAPKLGRDGLTAKEQMETYGRVLDAEE